MGGLLGGPAATLALGAGVVLVVATLIVLLVSWRLPKGPLTENLRQRTWAWWIMIAVLVAGLVVGETATILIFAALSFVGLREMLRLVPDQRHDRVLLALLYGVAALHYFFVWRHWYGTYSIFIPVYALLLLPAVSALRGRIVGFREHSASVQWTLMLSVYAISYVPALLQLPISMKFGREYAEGSEVGLGGPEGAALMLFLVIVVQGSDVLQYVWGKTLGRHPIAPTVSPNKTWEGFVGGVLSATVLGALLHWATPFSLWQAAAISLLSCTMGFLGGLVMSAIKRDAGIKDFGALIQGHGGVMDRLDSLAFAAPVFFHLTRFFFA